LKTAAPTQDGPNERIIVYILYLCTNNIIMRFLVLERSMAEGRRNAWFDLAS
jgi:hypothetical protein